MASLAQLTANRLNAQRSTGPRTEAGKAVSRFNALIYGVDAQSLVLPGEDPAALEALALEYHRSFNPSGPLEDYLVQNLVQADWSRRRYSRIEAQFVRGRLAAAPDSLPEILASPAAERIYRRLAAAERSYFRALKELRRAQKDRRGEEADAGEAGDTVLSPAPAPAPEIGFVPENAAPCSAGPSARPRPREEHDNPAWRL